MANTQVFTLGLGVTVINPWALPSSSCAGMSNACAGRPMAPGSAA